MLKITNHCLLSTLCLVISLGYIQQSQAQHIYRWLDENGKYRYSDKPRKGAELILKSEAPYIVPLKNEQSANMAQGLSADANTVAKRKTVSATAIDNTAKLKPLISQQKRCANNRNRLSQAQAELNKRQQQGMPEKSRQFYQKLVARYQAKVDSYCS